jgi:hypothetical protein
MEVDQDQDNIPPPPPASEQQQQEEEEGGEGGQNNPLSKVEEQEEEDSDDEEMRLAMSLSLGETVDISQFSAEEEEEEEEGAAVTATEPPAEVDSEATRLAGTTALVTRRVLQLLLRELSSPPALSSPLALFSSLAAASGTGPAVLRVSPLQALLFAPSPAVRMGYARLLYELYCTAMEVSGREGGREQELCCLCTAAHTAAHTVVF